MSRDPASRHVILGPQFVEGIKVCLVQTQDVVVFMDVVYPCGLLKEGVISSVEGVEEETTLHQLDSTSPQAYTNSYIHHTRDDTEPTNIDPLVQQSSRSIDGVEGAIPARRMRSPAISRCDQRTPQGYLTHDSPTMVTFLCRISGKTLKKFFKKPQSSVAISFSLVMSGLLVEKPVPIGFSM